MKKRWATWNWILKNLEANISVMLLYVLESSGSSPGRQGFFMAVNANGQMTGSIGGGIMEHKFVETAKAKLQQAGPESSIHKQIHNKIAARHQSGMICSGEQTIFLYKVQQHDIASIGQLVNSLELNITGALRLSPGGISFNTVAPDVPSLFVMHSAKEWSYLEKTGVKEHLYIIGAGHCALALSALMSTMDFFIHMFDEREELNTLVANDFIHEKRIVNNYSVIGDLVATGMNTYVVIMTFGYRSDYIALKALLKKEVRYLGVLGSKKKIEKMLVDLVHDGFTKSDLSSLHAPAGLPIKSETPEEIAVSIAAEIIREKNMHR